MAFQLATAFVRIGAVGVGNLVGVFDKVKGILMGTFRFMTGMVGKLGALAGAGLFAAAVKLGSDAEELDNMFAAVFGNGTEEANKFAETLALKLGRSVGNVKSQMAEFQDLFVPLGFARDQAADLSKQMVKLTQDVGSFKNIKPEEVAASFNSGLVGAHRALRRFGIVITQTSLDAELLAMGIEGGSKAASEQQKVLARLNIIMRSTADAHDDAEKTAGSFENRMKGLRGALKDVLGDIGSAFLPALAKIAKALTDLIRKAQPFIQKWSSVFARAGEVMVTNWRLAWKIVTQATAVGVSMVKDLLMQIPEIWSFMMGQRLRLVVNGFKLIWKTIVSIVKIGWTTLVKIWEQGWDDLGAILSGGKAKGFEGIVNRMDLAIDRTIGKFGKMTKAFKAGFFGKSLSDVLKPSQETIDRIDALTDSVGEFTDKMEDLKKEKAAGGAGGAGSGAAGKVSEMVVESMVLPKGFIDFTDANAKIQEALLDQKDPQTKMLSELKDGNSIAQDIKMGIDRVAANIGRLPLGAGVNPVATA